MTDEEYLNQIFKGVDSNIQLDEEQKEVILCDDDYLIVIAGAGAGKTTTMAAKVKYLVERKQINPEQILMISLTNRAVCELRDKINNSFGLPIYISTFHKFGMSILKKCDVNKRVCLNPISILRIFLKERLKDGDFRRKFIKFFSCYWKGKGKYTYGLKGFEQIKSCGDYISLLGRIALTNEKFARQLEDQKISLENESMRRVEEVVVANYLFLHNIIYFYQKPYPNSFSYLPDFTFIVNGQTYYMDLFLDKHTGIKLFKFQNFNKRIMTLHEKFHTKHIVLHGDGDLLEELEQVFKMEHIVTVEKNEKEIYFILREIMKDQEFDRFLELCFSFIHSFKMKGYEEKQFKLWKNDCTSKRNFFFLKLLEEMYQFYKDYMDVNFLIDFDDMIILATDLIKKGKIKFQYRYIIVDEYQDISKERFLFLKAVVKNCNSKLIAVGDDWQCIFSFAGSELSLFMNFKKELEGARKLQITHTYRNSQKLIDIAGNFVMKNNLQFKKKLISFKEEKYPVKIYLYDETESDLKSKFSMIEQCILDILNKEKGVSEIAFIGRYKKDIDILINSKKFYIQGDNIKNDSFPHINFLFLTVHASKGLGFEHVIILNGESGEYGFPSEKVNDSILDYVISYDSSYDDAEERRLFYVALTRTKNTVSVIAPIHSSSKFLKELYPVQIINGTAKKWESKVLKCPKCHSTLVRKYLNTKRINPLYCCTADSRICGFETNNLNFMIKIKVCPKCKSGYTIVKKSNYGYFLGCTNYKNGCNYFKKI